MKYANEEFYIGKFKDGSRDGKGILYYNIPKLVFFGNNFNDKLEGVECFNYQALDYYIGEWKDNEINGKGIVYFEEY